MRKHKNFWDRNARIYNRFMRKDRAAYEKMYELIRPIVKNKTVLELATGTGLIAKNIVNAAAHIEATDASTEMIAEAKRDNRSAKLHFSVQDATSLPYADETFDAVLIANALHIMPRPEKALAEIYRVLKPGGQLFAPTFVHGEVPRTRLRMLAMRCAGLQIYNSWMVPQYLAFLQAGGFAVQEHALLGDSLAPLCYARAVPDKTRVTQR